MTWLFSKRIDLTVFLGSALVAFALLGVGHLTGALHDDAPTWIWLPAVVLIDVAHVWSTAFRVYLDGAELRRRPWLYGLAPLFAYVAGVVLYSESELVFWAVLAYVAVFHFVRQQYGWVMRYRRGETSHYWLDTITIYTMTLYPLLHWHLNLPKDFHWFMPGDFRGITAPWLDTVGHVFFWVILGVWLAVQRFKNPGKSIVVLTTAACWYVGIVVFDSDYAFTVTNVIIHGVPYFAIVYVWMRKRDGSPDWRWAPGIAVYLLVLWLVAFGEELLWDKAIWHDHRSLFGGEWPLGDWKTYVVPLLALPQAVHYVLDGFIWRRQAVAEIDQERKPRRDSGGDLTVQRDDELTAPA